jgi:lauroyl/myristoyl acyltransferase
MARFVESIIWLRQRDSLAFTRPLLHVLKRNGVICSTADGSRGQRLALVQHLGRRRAFATGMVSLAKVSGATLLPLFCVQDDDGIPTLTIGPPIAAEAGAGRQSALQSGVTQWVALFEAHVKAHPGKYRAWHITFWDGRDREEGPSASAGPSPETLGGEPR